MSVFESFVKTYDAYEKKGNFIGEKQESGFALAPVAHTTLRPSIVINIDNDGNFISAEKYSKNAPPVVVPGNEKGESRSSSSASKYPYSLCDQLKYMVKGTARYKNFMKLLSDWDDSDYSHPVLSSVRNYLEKGTILEDLERLGMLKSDWGSDNIAWKFSGFPDNENNTYCWSNKSLMKSWTDYYLDFRSRTGKTDLCMITGEYGIVADFHPKNIPPGSGNGKLISCNDKSGFTYLGRFSTSSQANSVTYEASQKMHNTLRFLASDQGVKFGLNNPQKGGVIICWNPSNIAICNPGGRLLFDEDDASTATMADYKNQLNKALYGYENAFENIDEKIIVASFESATTGRSSLTGYAEINAAEYFKNLFKWDEECCWFNYTYGIQSPSLSKIVEFAYGNPKKEKSGFSMMLDDNLKFSKLNELVSSKIFRKKINPAIVKTLVNKASRLYLYDNNKYVKKYGTTLREALLTTVCSVLRKYYIERGKEFDMSVQKDNNDVSYLFGRLLAVMEKIEKEALGKDSKRETNAIRLQSRFTKTPLSTTKIVQEQLRNAYFSKLEPWRKVYFEKLLDEIMGKIGDHDAKELNRPLKDLYLIGYYQQRNDFYSSGKKKSEQNAEETNESDE